MPNRGNHLKLIISDGQPGLLKALRQHFTFEPRQHCIDHEISGNCWIVVELKRS